MNRDLEPIFHIYEYEEGIRKIAAHVVSEFKKRTFRCPRSVMQIKVSTLMYDLIYFT